MNKPVNVLRDEEVQTKQLAGVANVAYDIGKAQGKEGEKLVIEYSRHYDNTYTKLEEETTMEISIGKYIEIRNKEGEKYRINSNTLEPLIMKGQDAKRAIEVAKELKEVIKEFGLKLFNEMLEEKKYIRLGSNNKIDKEQIKLEVNAYLKEKEQKEQEGAR